MVGVGSAMVRSGECALCRQDLAGRSSIGSVESGAERYLVCGDCLLRVCRGAAAERGRQWPECLWTEGR